MIRQPFGAGDFFWKRVFIERIRPVFDFHECTWVLLFKRQKGIEKAPTLWQTLSHTAYFIVVALNGSFPARCEGNRLVRTEHGRFEFDFPSSDRTSDSFRIPKSDTRSGCPR